MNKELTLKDALKLVNIYEKWIDGIERAYCSQDNKINRYQEINNEYRKLLLKRGMIYE